MFTSSPSGRSCGAPCAVQGNYHIHEDCLQHQQCDANHTTHFSTFVLLSSIIVLFVVGVKLLCCECSAATALGLRCVLLLRGSPQKRPITTSRQLSPLMSVFWLISLTCVKFTPCLAVWKTYQGTCASKPSWQSHLEYMTQQFS